MQKNIPYLKFYVSDFYADSAVMGMTVEELGSYLNLLFICWREGSIPRDLKELTELNRGVTPTDRVIKKFSVKRGNSRRLVQKRLEKERFAYAEICKRRREAAYKGGQATKNKYVTESHLAPKRRHNQNYKQNQNQEESRSTLFSQDPSIKPLHSSRAQARKTPFLDGFQLDAEMIEFANSKHVDPIPEFDKFRDHHKAKGSLMKDWKAAWRTWVRRSPEFNGGNNGSARPVQKTFDQLRNERTDAALRRVREHYLQGTSKMLT